ncbi:TIGR02444 family protein [uncultured Kushneria sp.]|uniref:TIGR02444 family protein n=1 Tax=uncultured Kushneria sp. TaxID=905033 RepID=UPI002631FFBA|nr:TIGR02444 family protein [uncultured Kushneria sp.]
MGAHSNRNLPALWPWALAFYERPGVSDALLELQDEAGLDVCELLWGFWLLTHDRTPVADPASALAPVRQWQQHYTQPLRQLRRDLKAQVADRPELEQMRTHIKKAELQGEHETLRRLEALGISASIPRPEHFSFEALLHPLIGELEIHHQRLISHLRLESENMAPPSC